MPTTARTSIYTRLVIATPVRGRAQSQTKSWRARGPSALLVLLLVIIAVFSLESLNDVRVAISVVSDTRVNIFHSNVSKASPGPAATSSVSAKAEVTLEQRTAARAAALGRCIKSGSQVGAANGSTTGGGAAVVPEGTKCCEGKDDASCFRPLLIEAGQAVEVDRALTPGLGVHESLLFDDMEGGGAGKWLTLH